MRTIDPFVTLILFYALFTISTIAQNAGIDTWPRDIETASGDLIVYQPQPEKLEGETLEARAAISFEGKGASEPVFGVVWFKARLETDRDERLVTIADIEVTQSRFADQNDEKSAQLAKLLEKEIPKWDLEISLDRLISTIETRELQMQAVKDINTDVPTILFKPEPAVLISIDGEPRLKKEGDEGIMRVVNTPFTLLLNTKENVYYLNADVDTWYTATQVQGDWKIASNVPKSIAALAPQPDPDEEQPKDDDGEVGPPPSIVIATEPTELISSTGEPEYTPIEDTDLLYMSNTESDVLLHLNNQQHYVLLAGRWYAAGSLEGPWHYVPGEELPADFSKIPEDSQMGTVLYAVPGTDLAKEAVIDAQIPQTATIERDKANLTVEYDGAPEFEEIEETNMNYAVNTATPVIQSGSSYYAVDDAVWFVSSSATGPWVVATTVPDVIYTIPPASPVYHVTYVHVYGHTDEVIYVGYLPGYTGTYVYNTTILYGTGHYYPYWYRTYYYPRYCTWGFHVRYNPWTGWSFGFSYSNGPFRITIGRGGWYRGGWWGPARYRGYRRGYRRGARAGYRAGYRAGRRDATRQNMYRTQRNRGRATTQTRKAQTRSANAKATKGRANNVYADRNGNVHRKTDQGWQQRTQDGWKGSQQQPRTSDQPSSRPTSTKSTNAKNYTNTSSRNTQQLNQSYNARQHGTQRTNNYRQVRGGGRGRR